MAVARNARAAVRGSALPGAVANVGTQISGMDSRQDKVFLSLDDTCKGDAAKRI
ncbi:MAG: hypothetical protein WCX65_11335 [bacterium]